MTHVVEGFAIVDDAPGLADGPDTLAAGEGESASPAAGSGRWSLGLLGVIGYLIVEYGNLVGMYPVLRPFQMGKVAVFLAAAGYLMSRGTQRVTKCAKVYDRLLWALIFAAALGAAFAEHQAIAWSGVLDAVRWWGVFFIISRVLNTKWRIGAFVFVWLLLDLKLALHVVRSYATLASMPGVNEMSLVQYGIGGGSSFLSNSADFGVAMCVAWPVAVWLLLSRPKRWYRLLLIAGAPLFLAAILLCGSRGAVVGAVAIVLIALLRNPTKIAAALMLLSVAIGIWLVLPEASKQRFESARNPQQDLTANHRLLLWQAGLEMFWDNPLLGVGIDNYPWVRHAHYRIAMFDWIASVPHSTYIQAISELGIAGTLPLLLLWFYFFRLNAQTRRTILSWGPGSRRTFEFGLAAGLDLSMAGYMASGAFVSVLWYPHLFLMFGLSSALHSVCESQQDHAIQLTNRSRNQPQLAW